MFKHRLRSEKDTTASLTTTTTKESAWAISDNNISCFYNKRWSGKFEFSLWYPHSHYIYMYSNRLEGIKLRASNEMGKEILLFSNWINSYYYKNVLFIRLENSLKDLKPKNNWNSTNYRTSLFSLFHCISSHSPKTKLSARGFRIMLGVYFKFSFQQNEHFTWTPEQAIIQRVGKTHFNNNSHLRQDIIVNILFYFIFGISSGNYWVEYIQHTRVNNFPLSDVLCI